MLWALLLTQALVSFTTIVAGTASSIDEPRQVVVRSAEDWKALWAAHSPGAPVPPVDFSRVVVVGVFAGSRPTAGFGVTITAVTAEDGRVVVEYAERRPGPGDVVAQVLTSPFHVVSIPREAGPITFRSAKR